MYRELPLGLYKANMELQLQISRLLQEACHSWLGAAQKLSAQDIDETNNRIQGLVNSVDWQAATTLPAETFSRLLQSRMTDSESINQVALASQAAFADGFRQALVAWQKSVGTALRIE